MNGKKVLITGANGLVGNYMVDKCIQRGAFVTAVDINTPEKQFEGREAPKLLAFRTLYVAIGENRHILNPLISLLPNIVAQLVWSRLLDRHLSHHKNDWDESQSPCVA